MQSRFIPYLFFFSALISEFPALHAQPFDTLLLQYKSISQIYPLEDESFILIGQNEETIVERIDSTGKSIWSVSLGLNYNEDDFLDDFAVHMLPEDSSIQISVARKYCDYYDTSDVKVYTLTFDGHILDSLLVRAKELPQRITLLSGSPVYPRIAYILDDDVVLQYADGDTVRLQMTIPGADSIISQIVGPPVYMALSPLGTLLVGTRGNSLMRFKDDGTGYHFFKSKLFALYGTLSQPIRKLLSFDEEFYLQEYYDKIELHSFSNGLERSFSNPQDFYFSVISGPPYLYVMSSDTFYVLDPFLNKIYQEPRPEYEQRINAFAIRHQTTFTVGSGYFYDEGGFLASENQITHEGPKYYDIELVDFEIGPYDSVYWQYGFGSHYVYTIPDAVVTIKNNSDFAVQEAQVIYLYPVSYCAEEGWEKEIQQMDLLPGETKSFDLHDIFLLKDYPESQWYGACIYAIRPDNHSDDHFEDNRLCKKLEFLPLPNALPDFPIQHRPVVITDEINFHAPQDFDFDLRIYSFNGIEVFNSKANTYSGYSVNLNFLPAGIYIFQYYLPDRHEMYVEKILKY